MVALVRTVSADPAEAEWIEPATGRGYCHKHAPAALLAAEALDPSADVHTLEGVEFWRLWPSDIVAAIEACGESDRCTDCTGVPFTIEHR